MTGARNLQAPIVVALVLMGTIVSEFCFGNVDGEAPSLPPVAVVPPTKAAPLFPANAVESILSRPLFVPGRRMQAGEMVGHVDDGLPRLAGIVLAPDRKVAVFQLTGEKPKSLSEGDTVGTWTIKKIDHQQVVMQNSGGTMTLVPAKDTNIAGTPGAVLPQGSAFSGPNRRRAPALPGAPSPSGAAVRP